MREIKFRGLSKKGEWIYGDLIQRTHKFIFPTGVYAYNIFEFLIEVDHETVGQYTGLKDKNGTEIYERDIIENDGDDAHEVVTFDEGSFWLEGSTYTTPLHEVNTEAEEVIGNIHEHPHLLEVDSNA